MRGHREGDTDAALLRAVADGDPSALATLYDRHAGWLFARLSRRCADAEVVREVVQDTKGDAARRAELRERRAARERLASMGADERRTWLSAYFATVGDCHRNGVPAL
ncbi:RNA polymerase sigma factor [Streptomyces rishiriensis]|uniref:RNA polymerase sigma factor n=1 Tax=Streptomyces rishiriensis TaxID=68264 RepID=UPI0037D1B91C